jgi:tetratricopeptide (TPR) repeat protein
LNPAADKRLKESEIVQSPSETISLRSDFAEIQKEIYHDYGLTWLARDYFEFHKSSNNDLDNWKRGFSFELPSIKSKRELRRERIIDDIKTRLENDKRILIIGQSGSSKSTILMELICDYFDAGYEVLYNQSSNLKNIDGLVNFIEGRLRKNEKILVAVDDAHNERTNSIFYVLDKLSNIDLVESVFQQSISQMPMFLSNEKESELFMLISEAYWVLKKFQNALNSSNEALKLNSRNAMAYEKKGVALTDLGRHDEAVECFNKALEIDHSLASAWMQKGNTLDYSGHHKEAMECYDKALEIDPIYLALLVWINQGICFDNMRKHEKAIECYDKALNRVHFEKMLFQKSLELGEREAYLLEMKSHESNICRLKGVSLLYLGKYDEAIKYFDKALEINPNETRAWINKSDALFHLGKYEEAINANRELLNIDSGNVKAWRMIGDLRFVLGNYEEAIDCYDHVLKINSNHAKTWYYKGQALLKIGRSGAPYCFNRAKELGFRISIKSADS